MDVSTRAYLMELAPCVRLTLKFRRRSARVCPEDGCMSPKSVGIRRTGKLDAVSYQYHDSRRSVSLSDLKILRLALRYCANSRKAMISY